MSAVDDKYNSLGAESSFLGKPIGSETTSKADSNWSFRDYEHGSIYAHNSLTPPVAFEVHGDIAQKFYSLKREAGFGFPETDETLTFDGFGRMNYFDGGAIYWRSSTGPFGAHGAIGGRYQILGGPQSVLGYPLSDQIATSDNTGQWNQFEHGAIFWKGDGSLGAHEVHGAIFAKYKSLGMQAGSLGYPITNELPVASPPGARRNLFEKGAILWTPSGGAKVI